MSVYNEKQYYQNETPEKTCEGLLNYSYITNIDKEIQK